MGNYKPKKNDPNQDQDQDQKQANLQAQLQGQGQGQLQGQGQFAVQTLDSKSHNDNNNDNKNTSDNKNTNDNKVDNNLDNKTDNKTNNAVNNDLDNKVENKVENTVDTKVNVDVNVDLKVDGLSSPVIDLHGINNIHDSVIMPEVVNQNLNGGYSNAFNIDQVNNLVDNDHMTDPSVTFTGGSSEYPGGGFHMDAKAEGGDSKVDSKMGEVIGNSASGVTSHADATLTQDAFNQTITQGANIQFNSVTIQAVGHDLQDSHDLHS